MRNKKRGILIWMLIILFGAGIYNTINSSSTNSKKVVFSEFLDQVKDGNIKEVTIRDRNITAKSNDNLVYTTLAPMYYTHLVDLLYQKDVKVEIAPNETVMGGLFGVIFHLFSILLPVAVLIYFVRGSGGNKAMSFGKVNPNVASNNNKVTFADVAGVEEAKEELQEVVDFLKNPERFQKFGGKIPRGCLLIGAPGTGKTLLARAVAGEADVPFFNISGSDFVEMFVGVGASRVRDMFRQAKKHPKCIIFIDEIDAIGKKRGSIVVGGNDEREQTLNQLLVEMDGFEVNQGIIIIAATNRPDVLDQALLRPGRFDRQVEVPLPDINGREEILKVHLKNNKVPVSQDVNVKVIARGTPGVSGADLANIVNEAALMAARIDAKYVNMEILETAKDKIIMGKERRSMVMTHDEKKRIAYHEAGHAIVILHTPGANPLHKVTIIPRGGALGVTMNLPEHDRHITTKEQLSAYIITCMGGRIAEELIFGHDHVTNGASGDIQTATNIAAKMVMKWGLSNLVGNVLIESSPYSDSLHNINSISEDLKQKIDQEIKNIIDLSYQKAKAILEKYLDDLHKLANALLERETLSGEDVNALLSLEDGKNFAKLKEGSEQPVNH